MLAYVIEIKIHKKNQKDIIKFVVFLLHIHSLIMFQYSSSSLSSSKTHSIYLFIPYQYEINGAVFMVSIIILLVVIEIFLLMAQSKVERKFSAFKKYIF